MDLFNNIQNIYTGLSDSISSTVGDIASSLGTDTSGLKKAAGNALKTQNDINKENAANISSAKLNEGLLSVGQDQFPKTDTGAVASVNPEAMEALWLSRLNKFAQIKSETGV